MPFTVASYAAGNLDGGMAGLLGSFIMVIDRVWTGQGGPWRSGKISAISDRKTFGESPILDGPLLLKIVLGRIH